MTQNQLREAAAAYGAAVADLQQPVVLERDGHPVAVIISFEEYQRLRRTAYEEGQRQRAAWLDLEKLLSTIHTRPTTYTPEEIEAEITAARVEVRKERRDEDVTRDQQLVRQLEAHGIQATTVGRLLRQLEANSVERHE